VNFTYQSSLLVLLCQEKIDECKQRSVQRQERQYAVLARLTAMKMKADADNQQLTAKC
jgi:hypothetical protein